MVDIYIKIGEEYKKIEQFSDEKISVTSSIQNFNDIGKLFTDYSQSFTVPASTNNNKIFAHWYDNSLDGGFDHRIRYDAYIEIDTIPFKKGRFQIEKANKKDGYIENYQITFYGNLTQLKDKFADDKLQRVFETTLGQSLNHAYDATNVQNRIELGTAYDVRYPLVGNNRPLRYADASPNDITTNAGAVVWSDLFPAVRLTKVLELIEDKYAINFTGSFLAYNQFTKLSLLLKNSELPRAYSQGLRVDFLTKTGVTFPELNLTTDLITTNWDSGFFGSSGPQRLILKFKVTPSNSTLYKIDLYVDGQVYNTFENLTGIQEVEAYNQTRTDDPDNHEMYFVVSTLGAMNFQSRLEYIRRRSGDNVSTGLNLTGQSITFIQNIGAYVPDIKVEDFFMGIVKMFNLMVTPTEADTFDLQPLDLFYQSGTIDEASKYIYSKEVDIEKPKLFKNINFKYENSENILNSYFRGAFNREYGDLVFENPNSSDSSTYEVKLPFENPMWERATGYDFITNTFLNSASSSYTPKAVLMYENGLTAVTPQIKLNTGVGYNSLSNYIRFSNEYNLGGSDLSYLYSINWGNEISAWYLVNAPQGLYRRLYQNYISNLYNIKTRVLKVKAKVTSMFLNALQLKDRLIIRDNRYIINTMTTDSTTNEVDFELVNDYRAFGFSTQVGYRFASIEMLNLDNTAQEVEILFYKGEFASVLVPTSVAFISNTGTGVVENDVIVNFSISANATGLDRTHTINAKYTDSLGVVTDFLIDVTQYA